ncbi:hypothetical protein [Actinoplanes sp. OR16]|uniref:hypothetical protein n=1 Tax=Actinoplanes sp. OR16 TaxID=946334 RepID=UPI000FD719E6|nr:hypothetical protein [Actinoplanes sp. OR16]
MIASTGGGGGTDWASLRLDQMWAMLASHDPEANARLIGGWRQSHDLALRHLADVRDYRDRLATAWDPSRSRAAAAYFTRLDALIADLEETSEAAIANQRAFSGATGALQSARQQMAEIHREHAANEVLLAAFAEAKRLYQLSPGKARGVPPQRPVPEGRQALLEARARMVMQSLSTELAKAQSALVVPRPYEPDLDTTAGLRLPLPRTAPTLTDPRSTASESAAGNPRSATPRGTTAAPRSTMPGARAGTAFPRSRTPGAGAGTAVPRSTTPGAKAGAAIPRSATPREATPIPRSATPRGATPAERSATPRGATPAPRSTTPRGTSATPRSATPRADTAAPRSAAPESNAATQAASRSAISAIQANPRSARTPPDTARPIGSRPDPAAGSAETTGGEARSPASPHQEPSRNTTTPRSEGLVLGQSPPSHPAPDKFEMSLSALHGVIGATPPHPSQTLPPPLNGPIGHQPPRPPGHFPDPFWEIAEGVPPIIEPTPEDPPDPGPTIGRIPRNRA